MLVPVLQIFSLFLLFRGHNEPGGGFAGGLLAGAAYTLYLMAYKTADARRILPASPQVLIGMGLLVALASGFAGPAVGKPFLTGVWGLIPGTDIKLGSPFVFDIGVYLAVLGVVLLLELAVVEREEEEHG